jgi:hypothetical protein
MLYVKPVKVFNEQGHTHMLMSDGTTSCISDTWLGRPNETEIIVKPACWKDPDFPLMTWEETQAACAKLHPGMTCDEYFMSLEYQNREK